MPRPLNTTVPRLTKRQQFDAVMVANRWNAVHTAEWDELRRIFSEGPLREWLAESSIDVDQPYRGVDTKTFDSVEASLTAMSELYERDPAARKLCRTTVIVAKDRTRFASKNPKVDPFKRTLKSEMVEWMLVWLSDPAMFPSWAAIRKKLIANCAGRA